MIFSKFGEYCKFIHFEKKNHVKKQLEVSHLHEEEIVTKRSVDDKISQLEKIISDKDDKISNFVAQI
jgi:hypothetical protein